MGKFNIDFFELAFLAEACIPPSPIARTMFWQNLTNSYWEQMTEEERIHLFEWMNRNEWYKKSLENEEDTKIFHARFDPDNQYNITTNFNNDIKIRRAFKLNDKYFISLNSWIANEYITSIEKFNPKKES